MKSTEDLSLAEDGTAWIRTVRESKESRKRGKGGRPPKSDPAGKCLMVCFTAAEYAGFLSMYEQSGIRSKARFILARIRSDGTLISDEKDFEWSRKITDDLEQKYSLHPKDKKQGEAWQA